MPLLRFEPQTPIRAALDLDPADVPGEDGTLDTPTWIREDAPEDPAHHSLFGSAIRVGSRADS